MEEIDVSLPSKFMDACVAKDKDKALRLAKLMAKQHNCTLKAELDILDFDASMILSIKKVNGITYRKTEHLSQ